MARAASVFVSYSRSDYYFAESLSFHLCRLGLQAWMDVKDLLPGTQWEQSLLEAVERCDALVLVASPAGLASANVRNEWQRALAAGKRIVLLGWHRRVRLPRELQGCEWIDFRGRFSPALRRLVAALGADAPRADARAGSAAAANLPRAGPHPGRGPWLPPAVLAMLIALAAPIIGYALAVAPDVASTDFSDLGLGLGRVGDMALFAALTLAVVWGLCLSLVQRRMGMTRLMLCLGFVATPFLLAAWKLARHGAAGLQDMPPLVAQAMVQHRPLAWALAALPLAAMAVVWWWRPGGLLRWMPTGKGWSRYRVVAALQSRLQVRDAAQTLAGVGAFRLVHDSADQPMAQRLHDELLRHGAAPAQPDDAQATTVVLLSNHSSLQWVAREVQPRAAHKLLTVVGSAIGLRPELDWLWQRQWLDLRSWAPQRPAAEQGLPGLPEAATVLRLPRPVALLHAQCCAFAALVGTVAVALEPKVEGGDNSLSTAQACAFAALLLALWAARQLARRGTTLARLQRMWPLAGIGGVLSLVFAELAPGAAPQAQPVAWMGGAVAAAIALWAWRSLPASAFWLPSPLPKGVPPAARLLPKADWRTFGTTLAFMALWALLLQIGAPGLLDR